MGRAALILIMGFALLVTSSWLSLNRISRSASEEVSSRYSNAVARNVANSATQRAISKLDSSYHAWTAGYSGEWFAGAQYWTTITPVSRERYDVATTAVFEGDTARVKVALELPSLSRFAWFTDSENLLAWSSGDVISGPIHTNGFFTMNGTPRFTSEVSSSQFAGGTVDSPYTRNPPGQYPIFEQPDEVRWGVPPIVLQTTRDVTALQNRASQSPSHLFNRHIWIQLGASPPAPGVGPPTATDTIYIKVMPTATDTLSIPRTPPGRRSFARPATGTPAALRPDSVIWMGTLAALNGGIIATDNTHDIHVWGVLKGELTICSGRDLYIEDDVIYAGAAGAPSYSVPTTCVNYLGLVARRDIIISYGGTSATGDATDPNQNKCGINASLLAYRSFKAQNHMWPSDGSAPRDTLFVVGSVVQSLRGNISTTAPSGYTNKVLTYDSRLATHMPPLFPLFDHDKVLAWIE